MQELGKMTKTRKAMMTSDLHRNRSMETVEETKGAHEVKELNFMQFRNSVGAAKLSKLGMRAWQRDQQ
jgi:hypothetical protein